MLVDITHQDDSSTKTGAYTDDFTDPVKTHSAEKMMGYVMSTWSEICWHIMKGHQEHAVKKLQQTKIKMTTDGQRHSGAVIGSIQHKCKSKKTQ